MDFKSMSKIMVRKKIHKRIYIHNDLSNAAYSFKKAAIEKITNDERHGVSHDIMACLIFCAYTAEAHANYLGNVRIKAWDEKDNLKSKYKTLLKSADIQVDWIKRPFETIVKLVEFRNNLAHGKPEIVELDITEEIGDERDLFKHMIGVWEAEFLTDEFFIQAKEDVREIWQILLEGLKIDITETITSASMHEQLLSS